jgi:carbon storage regulator
MLVLRRKQGERIIIGDDIEVMVLGSQGNRVRIGLTAPPEVQIHRQEVADRIDKRESLKRARLALSTSLGVSEKREDQYGSCLHTRDEAATA